MKKLIKFAFILWVVLWAFFEVRMLIKEGYYAKYSSLIGKNQEARRGIVYGQELYSFLQFAANNMQPGATYRIEGLERGSIDLVRAHYYLYPILVASNPDYILVFNHPSLNVPGYDLYRSQNINNYLLRKAVKLK